MDDKYTRALVSISREHGVQEETLGHVEDSSGDVKSMLTANEKVRYIQNHSGFNDKELGDIFGVSRRSIQNWVSGSAISESNAAKINLFYTKMVSLTGRTSKEARAVLTSHAEGERFIQDFKRSTKQAQTMLVPTPIEARFV